MAKHKYKKRRENQMLREEQAKAAATAKSNAEQENTVIQAPTKDNVAPKKQKTPKDTSTKPVKTEKRTTKQKDTNGKRKLSGSALACIILASIAVLLGILVGVFYLTLPDVNPFNVKAVAGEEIGLRYTTDAPYNSYTKMTFELDGKTFEVDPVDNNGLCDFFFTNVQPHQLGHTIKATLTIAGVTKQTDNESSVRDVMLAEMESSEMDDNQRKLYSELIQYAEYARVHNNRYTTAPDDVSILDFKDAEKYQYQPTDIKQNIVANMYGFGFSTSDVSLAYINVTYIEGSRYAIAVNVPTNSDVKWSDVSIKVNGTDYTLTETNKMSDSVFIVYTDIIPTSQWLQKIAVNVYVKDEMVQEASYGLLDYLARMQPTEGNDVEINHAKALYYYANAFQVYNVSLNHNAK